VDWWRRYSHYNFFRTYGPAVGQYLEADQICQSGGINEYVYARNNPLRYADVLGRASVTNNLPYAVQASGNPGPGQGTCPGAVFSLKARVSRHCLAPQGNALTISSMTSAEAVKCSRSGFALRYLTTINRPWSLVTGCVEGQKFGAPGACGNTVKQSTVPSIMHLDPEAGPWFRAMRLRAGISQTAMAKALGRLRLWLPRRRPHRTHQRQRCGRGEWSRRSPKTPRSG